MQFERTHYVEIDDIGDYRNISAIRKLCDASPAVGEVEFPYGNACRIHLVGTPREIELFLEALAAS